VDYKELLGIEYPDKDTKMSDRKLTFGELAAVIYDAKTDPPASLAGMQMKVEASDITADQIARHALRSCYKMPLVTAVSMGLKSIAYPAISAGIYGCPVETCAEVALGLAQDYLDWPIDVTFYLYPAWNLTVWQKVASAMSLTHEVVLG